MPSSCHIINSSPCPCGSGKPLAECCLPYIDSQGDAPTAEALMRSRYTAHVLIRVDYLMNTWAAEDKSSAVVESVRSWAEGADWKGLSIVSTQDGNEQDTSGIVEFIAAYKFNGRFRKHHEISRFERINGQWLYVEALT